MKKTVSSLLLASTALLAADVGINASKGAYTITESYPTAIVKPNTDVSGAELFLTNDALFIERESLKNYSSFTFNKTANTSELSLLVGLVEEYKVSSATLYAGALVGYGQLSYDFNPLGTSLVQNKTTTSALYGVTAGAKYSITENFFVNVNLKYMRNNYEVALQEGTTTGNIKHESLYSAGLGFGYSFDTK